MQQSRLVKYLEALPGRERERFRQFTASPYFNQHEKTQELLDIILGSFDGKSRQLDRARVFRRLFPREAFDEQKLHNLMSYLMKLYHRFLAVEHFQKRPFVEELYTLEEANLLNQYDLMTNRARQLEKHLETHPSREAHFHYVNYRLHTLMGYYQAGLVKRSYSPRMQQMLDHFDLYYLATTLRNACHLTANMMMINTRYELAFLDPLLQQVEAKWEVYGSEPAVELYHTILLSLRDEGNPDHYRHLKRLMANSIDRFSSEERADLYQFSYNYCIRQLNQGHGDFRQDLFELYQQGLRNGLLLSNGFLSEWDYKNIVTLTCQLREFDWTEHFIEEYKDKLPANRRDNAYIFSLATLNYSKQQYEDTLLVLQKVQFTDDKYLLNRHYLVLRTYYAMRETEVLLNHIESFRIYIIRNRSLPAQEKRSYTNFLRFAKKLVLLRHNEDTYSRKNFRERLLNLARDIRAAENVIYGNWLLEECQVEEEAEL